MEEKNIQKEKPMKSLNQCSFIGNLTRDPEMKYTTTGKAVTKFTIAVSGLENSQTQFINIVTWQRLAEICGEYLTKGRQVFIQGRYEQSSWEKDGQKQYKVEIIAEQMQMLGNKEQNTQPKLYNDFSAKGIDTDPIYEDIPF